MNRQVFERIGYRMTMKRAIDSGVLNVAGKSVIESAFNAPAKAALNYLSIQNAS